MIVDASLLLCATLLLSGGSCAPERQVEAAIKKAHTDLAGEHWYQVLVHGTHVGSLRERRNRTASGEYSLEQILTFKLTPSRRTRVVETLRFAAGFPHRLVHAEQATSVQQDGTRQETTQSVGLETLVTSETKTFGYGSTMPFHPALRGNARKIQTKEVDFKRDRIATHAWSVLPSESSSTIAERDNGDITYRFTRHGLLHSSIAYASIELKLVDHASAAPSSDAKTLFNDVAVGIPVDRPLTNHRDLERLVLRVFTSEEAQKFWQPLLDEKGLLRIERHVERAIHQAVNPSRDVSPNQTATVEEFIREAGLKTLATEETVKRLVDALHDYITPVDIPFHSTVSETLTRRTGDCTEFADAFDAIAYTLGWRTRIRDGLAYHPLSQSFRAHSWNEVMLDGQWIAVDASWGQFPADASHIPFAPAHTIAMLAHAPTTRFEVVDHHYVSN